MKKKLYLALCLLLSVFLAHGQTTPFPCSNQVYLVSVATGATSSTLSSLNVTTGARTVIAPLSTTVNATGYNPVDNLIWGYDLANDKVVRIDATGALTSFTIDNLPKPIDYNVGEVITGGYLVLYQASGTRYYVVDINPTRATYLKLVDPANSFALQTVAPYGKAISTAIGAADWVYNAATGLINGVISPTVTNARRLFTLNLATGAVTLGATATGGGIEDETIGYGGQFTDPSGSLYAIANAQGRFYKINQSTGAATLLSNTITSSGNDGASCPTADLVPPQSFTCSAGLVYQVSQATGETTSTLYSFNVSNGVRTSLAVLPTTVNAVGYNPVDNLIWGFDATNKKVVRIDAQGTTSSFPPITGLPIDVNYFIGEVTTTGYLVLYAAGASYYVVDVNPARATYLKLVDPANSFALQTAPYGKAISTPINPADWVYNAATGLINGIISPSGANARRLFTLNLATGAVTLGATATGGGIEGETSAFGGQFTDPSGSLYAFANAQGRFYKINQSTGIATFQSKSIPSAANDGASCPTADLDYPKSFSCTPSFVYQLSKAAGEASSTLYGFNINTGVRSAIATLTSTVNAVGYNPLDNLIWGYDETNFTVVRLDAKGTISSFSIDNLPKADYFIGEVTTAGYLVLYGASTNYYVVDVNPARATFLQLVDPANSFALQTAPYGKALSTPINPADWVYNAATGLINGIISPSQGVAANRRRLFTLNLATGTVTLGAIATGGGIEGETFAFGAQFIDPSGSLYAFANDQGKYYKINQGTGAATLLSNSIPSANNDGASCPTVILAYSISGNVFFDANGLTDNTVNGTTTNLGGQLNAILYDNTSGIVSGIASVSTNGTFSFGATPGHTYTTYITTNTATVGQTAMPVVVLPAGYFSTGEHLGAGTGNDGTPNGILSIGTVNADVTNANFGIEGTPDLTPIIYARSSTVYNTSSITVVVDVIELLNVSTTGLITVRVSKEDLVSLTFTPGTITLDDRAVQNSQWSLDAISDADYYILTTNSVIAPGGQLSFGFSGTLTPGATTGMLTFSTSIVGGSGGELKINNNNDADRIDYFEHQ